ncbi:unnamed protein product [Gadus morhua 'NCC']
MGYIDETKRSVVKEKQEVCSVGSLPTNPSELRLRTTALRVRLRPAASNGAHGPISAGRGGHVIAEAAGRQFGENADDGDCSCLDAWWPGAVLQTGPLSGLRPLRIPPAPPAESNNTKAGAACHSEGSGAGVGAVTSQRLLQPHSSGTRR